MRSNTFHWAFMVAGVFAVFVTVLFGFIYWKIDDYLTARSDRVITAQMDRIAGLPPDRRLEAIDERLRQDPRGVQLDSEDSSSAVPAGEDNTARSVVEVEGRANPVDVRRPDSLAVTVDADDLAPADPANRVDGVDPVVEHAVARGKVGPGIVLVELADGMNDRSALEAGLA